jgi:hypothetical protein
MKFNKQLFLRKTHRYLGLFIGIQFLGWTISGIYFSWNDIDRVHGDHLRATTSFIASDVETISPTEAIKSLRKTRAVDSIHSVQLINLIDRPTYQIAYFSGHTGEGMHLHLHYSLCDALTGIPRPALDEQEAIAVSKLHLTGRPTLKATRYLEQTSTHHEYREKPLPAWAITFDNPECTLYISSELGTLQAIRHDQWRVFDFLWMFHTMDYAGRDNFNNWLLRILSVFGLLTVMSGFVLYLTSSKTLKKAFNK